MRSHTHDLDGILHEDCPECELTRQRQPLAQRVKLAEEALTRYQKVAEKAKVEES